MRPHPATSSFFPYTTLFRSLTHVVKLFGLLDERVEHQRSHAFARCVDRSEEHTSELQSLSFISYSLFFFNETPPSYFFFFPLHDALPISHPRSQTFRSS